MVKRKDNGVSHLGRRSFLKGAALSGAAAVAAPVAAAAQTEAPKPQARSVPAAPARETAPPAKFTGPSQATNGSDYMVDVMRSLGIEHIALVPGSTFKGLQESVINHGMTSTPKLDLLTVMHEEQSVAFCHGYAKVSGKPMACVMHSTVGLQHGSMALYNAWADRAPVFALVGAHLDATKREGRVDWIHSVFDGPALVRDFIKWDDTPVSLGHFGQSAVRAYKFMMTPPCGPVLLALDEDLQEDEIPGGKPPAIPRMPEVGGAQGEQAAVEECARFLVNAQNPVIAADRAARTPKGLASMIELAEALQCAVVDIGGRMNFPWRHPLNQTSASAGTLAAADMILGLEMTDFAGTTDRYIKPGLKRISITGVDAYMKSNYQDFERFTEVDLAIAADAETTLPSLIEAVKRLIDSNKRIAFEARGKRLGELHQRALTASRNAAAIGWDVSPITTARMVTEVHEVIRNEDWGLVNGADFQNYWPQKLWAADKHHQYIGDSGAYGIGYQPGAAAGAAFAHKEQGRIPVIFGGDGDLMFSPGALWTLAHERIPLLYVVHNNRAWHQEIMWIQQMAARRDRGIDRAHIGTTITDPFIDYAGLAKSLGVYGEGPISDPKELGPAIRRAVERVKAGEPALVDVVSQGR